MNQSGRIQYIDLYRGIGIILMVLGHVGIWGTFDYWIHGFHMPMFFFISGYLYVRHDDCMHYLRSRARTLLIPYICYGLLAYCIVLVVEPGTGIDPLIRLFTFNTSGLSLGSAIWFLTALFWVYVIYQIVERLPISFLARTILYYGLSIVGCMETSITGGRFPLALGPALVGIGLFHTARWIHNCTGKGKGHGLTMVTSRPVLFCWFIGEMILIFLNDEVNMREGRYGLIVLFWFNAISSSLLLLNLCREYWHRCQDCKWLKWINQELEYIGRNAIIYVCLNQLMLFLLAAIWDISGYSSVARLLFKLVRFMIALGLMHLLGIVINNTWLCVSIGKSCRS